MEPYSLEEFNARHCACTDDSDPEIASELVFTVLNKQLYVSAHGKGEWPNVTTHEYVLTEEATTHLLSYLHSCTTPH